MIKKMKFLLSVLVLTLSFSSAQAGLFGTAVAAATGAAGGTATGIGPVPGAIAGVGAAKFAKKHPILTTIAVGVGGTVAYQKSTIHIARDLSYHLEKVEPYFRENPEKFDEIANYVRNALAHPANKNDYDRYERLAINMGLGNIPPYIPVGNNGQTVYENPIQEVNNGDNIYINPSNTNAGGGNIIYTPQGKAIDTSTEFPNNQIRSWDDYLLFKSQSQILADRMAADTINKYGIRPKGYAAHHIVAWDDNRYAVCQDLRDLLNNEGIDINDSINGVYLPTRKATKNNNEAYHPEIHTEEYYNNVYDKLEKYVGDPQGMKNELKQIGEQLNKNQFKYK